MMQIGKKFLARARKEDKKGQLRSQLMEDKDIRTKLGRLEKQLQCAAKGHKMRFNGGSEGQLYTSGFPFKCWNCGLEIIKTYNELVLVETEALKDLKLYLRSDKENKK